MISGIGELFKPPISRTLLSAQVSRNIPSICFFDISRSYLVKTNSELKSLHKQPHFLKGITTSILQIRQQESNPITSQ